MNGEIRHMVISPASFGLKSHPLAHVKSGTSEENAAVASYLFSPETHSRPDRIPQGAIPAAITFTSDTSSKSYTIPEGTHIDAIHDFILLQTSALLYVAGRATTLQGAVKLARKSLCLGGAQRALEILRTEANRAGEMLERQQKEKEERELRRINKKDELYYSKDLRNAGPNTDVESES
jgi:anthranilate phosphoribosyltransferase